MNYTAAWENLASTMNRAGADRDPATITRKRDQAVVILSLDGYESLQETSYPLQSPAKAKQIFHAIEAAEKHYPIKKSLPDLARNGDL